MLRFRVATWVGSDGRAEKSWSRIAVAAFVAMFTVGASAQSGKQPSERALGAKHVAIADPATRFVPGEVLVRFREGVSAAARADALGDQGATLAREMLVPGLVLVRIKPGQGVPGAVQAFERRSDVEYAEPNWIYRPSATPNDPRLANGELWGLHNTGQNGGLADADIDGPEAWDTTTGSSNVVVRLLTPASRTTIPTWRRTSGRIPARSRVTASTTTATAGSTTTEAGTSSGTTTILATSAPTGRMSQARSAPGATTRPAS